MWTDADREKALSLHLFKGSLCPGGCGTERAEWDPDLGGDPDKYLGGISRCDMCAVLAQEGRNIYALAEGRPEGADGARPILRLRALLPTDEHGEVIDDD